MRAALNLEHVLAIALHHVPAAQLNERSSLEGALAAPFHEFEGYVPYPTVTARAVKLAEGLSRVQAFSDGNKRLGWLCMATYLNLNGHDITDSAAAFNRDWMLSLMCSEAEHASCEDGRHSEDRAARRSCDEQRFQRGVLWLNERIILLEG